jgi:hypothetical protein
MVEVLKKRFCKDDVTKEEEDLNYDIKDKPDQFDDNKYKNLIDFYYTFIYYDLLNFIVNRKNNTKSSVNVKSKLISTTERDFNIYVNKLYDGYTYKEISEHYNITPTRIAQIIKYIDRRFKEFCNIKLNTVFSLKLDTRTRNVLGLQLKFNEDTPIEELYKHNAKYYLHLRNFGQSSLDKLNDSLIKSGHPKIE